MKHLLSVLLMALGPACSIVGLLWVLAPVETPPIDRAEMLVRLVLNRDDLRPTVYTITDRYGTYEVMATRAYGLMSVAVSIWDAPGR